MALKEHLLNLDGLKEGIHLRSYAQKNPIDEYRHESYNAFMDMWFSIKGKLFSPIISPDFINSALEIYSNPFS